MLNAGLIIVWIWLVFLGKLQLWSRKKLNFPHIEQFQNLYILIHYWKVFGKCGNVLNLYSLPYDGWRQVVTVPVMSLNAVQNIINENWTWQDPYSFEYFSTHLVYWDQIWWRYWYNITHIQYFNTKLFDTTIGVWVAQLIERSSEIKRQVVGLVISVVPHFQKYSRSAASAKASWIRFVSVFSLFTLYGWSFSRY